MKPTCKSEARYLFWRVEYRGKHRLDKFTQYAKKTMNKARRRYFKREIMNFMQDAKNEFV